MKRTIITITASLLAVKAAKEIKSFARSKWNLETYLLGKQIDRAERDTEKNKRQHRRDTGRKLAGHNILASEDRRDRTGHNVMTGDSGSESLNYHQAVMG